MWMKITSSSGVNDPRFEHLTDEQLIEGVQGIVTEECDVDEEEIQMQKHVRQYSTLADFIITSKNKTMIHFVTK